MFDTPRHGDGAYTTISGTGFPHRTKGTAASRRTITEDHSTLQAPQSELGPILLSPASRLFAHLGVLGSLVGAVAGVTTLALAVVEGLNVDVGAVRDDPVRVDLRVGVAVGSAMKCNDSSLVVLLDVWTCQQLFNEDYT